MLWVSRILRMMTVVCFAYLYVDVLLMLYHHEIGWVNMVVCGIALVLFEMIMLKLFDRWTFLLREAKSKSDPPDQEVK